VYPYWYVAPAYTIEGASENSRGTIVVKGEASDGMEMAKGSRARLGPYAPLQCPELVPSFARLVSHGRPAEKSILRWVNKYGLLHATERQESHPSASVRNQADISVEDFVEEALQVRSVLSLYADLHGGGVKELRKSVGELQRRQEEFKPLSQLDEDLLENWRNTKAEQAASKGITFLQIHATASLQNAVDERLSGVQPSLFDNLYSMGNSRDRYEPLPSWQCRDLISAMYLQIFFWMVTAVPLQRCAVPTCRTPFPLTRSDKRVCSDSCRSNLRNYR